MPVFTPQKTFKTDQPTVEVTVLPSRPLPAGRYRFQLVVVNEAGAQSAPAFLTVEIRSPILPIPPRIIPRP